MASEKYQAYLCSREWGLKREAVIERSGGICERCKRNDGDAVHHKTYKRIYNEPLTDLIYLCEACHDFTHGRADDDPMQIDNYDDREVDQLYTDLLHWWSAKRWREKRISFKTAMFVMARIIGGLCADEENPDEKLNMLLTIMKRELERRRSMRRRIKQDKADLSSSL
jgi:hypothetical protein